MFRITTLLVLAFGFATVARAISQTLIDVPVFLFGLLAIVGALVVLARSVDVDILGGDLDESE
jgi:hypothetical protein